MSRIRSVHPSLWTDEDFVSVSPLARLLFIGIWNECDDKGVFVWSPLQMKMRLLPADNVDAAELLAELERVGRVLRYTADDGRQYGAVRNFAKWQRPKSPNDIHPATPEILQFAGHIPDLFGSYDEVVGKRSSNGSEKSPQREEGGGRGGDKGGGSSRGSKLPTDFVPVLTENAQQNWRALADPDRELQQFKDHHAAKGSVMKDWQAAFRTWLSNAVKFQEKGGRNGRSAWLDA